MGIVSVNNEGVLFIEYDTFIPLADEVFTLESPDLTQWSVQAFGDTGLYLTDSINGPFPAAIRKVYASPNGTAWELTIDNTGVLFLTSFSSSLLLSPVGNSQWKLADGTLAVGFKLFTLEIQPITFDLIEVDTFADTSRININPNPLIINAQGFTGTPIFIEAGRLYTFQLAPASEVFPPGIIEQEFQDIAVGFGSTGGNITEWVEPPHDATVIGTDTITLPGDQRRQYQVGRRVRLGTESGPE
jgi:hypothetical protein